MNRNKFGLVPLIGLLVATLVLSSCDLRVGASPELAPSTSPSVSASAEPAPTPSPTPQAPTLEEKATVWVSMLLSNFADPGLDTEKCTAYKPAVDLTEVHFYFDERTKESAGAFGPDFGSTPCE